LRRIDDFLKLLLGLVIGQFLREAHQIRDGLCIMMHVDCSATGMTSLMSELFPYCLVAFFIRNVHASFRYDSWVSKRNFSPSYESKLSGRVWSFLASLIALFVSPYAVEHFLAGHLDSVVSVQLLVTALVLPFLIYFIWDCSLWLDTDGPTTRKDKVMQQFVKGWLIIDAFGMAWLLFCLALFFGVVGNTPDRALLVALICFSFLTVGTVVADYVLNGNFYFQEVRPLETRGQVPEPDASL
jgi:hypothetical protein